MNRHALRPLTASLLATLLLTPLALAAETAPEAATGTYGKTLAYAPEVMVTTANPLATEAGLAMLRKGGSAIDAAIAAQLMLGLTEPQSSGIAGGAFLLYHDGKQTTSFDGREKAPAAAKPERFLDPNGKPLAFYDAVIGGRSVGVPGVLAMLHMAHQRHGKLPWAALFEPAISRAENGFQMSSRLHALLVSEPHLKKDANARAYFYQEDGKPWPVGSVLKNPEYAATLRAIAAGGPKAFYSGKIAQAIVDAVKRHPTNPGDLTLADFAAYKAVERQPICGLYRFYKVCGMNAPSSGGVAVLQMLGILETRKLADWAPHAVESAHLFTEAGRLAFADRAKYLADPDFVKVPSDALVSKPYLVTRSQQIDMARSMGRAQAGDPVPKMALGLDSSPEFPSTSHLIVIDKQGHAVSMTSSIEDVFGSRMMVKGFLLNNQLTDFSFSPTDNGQPVANRVEPGKRPRSSMSPVLVFNEQGQLAFAAGSPGGSQIINYVAQTLVGLIDWKLSPLQAVALPHYGSRNGPTELEKDTGQEALAEALKAKGHEVKFVEMNSGLSAVVVKPDGLWGGADPRREGVAKGF
ncbi:gamma-glutamyltransferase [Parachitinimonas caeni]|uniref:Glutathione hydrolase proenzyme n=1 Tax=Parachitinimonas caeni TaxID=3031301 RepID=A0ABT7DWI7_9NEIS|nr:gamma-glutamyltransferase [Parachitinimonas caeni]MDK2124428.1 gamma-glutamyltransferase [Parachitinimonas caeni]